MLLRKVRRISRVSPAQIIIIGFLLLILFGTALLMLPFATKGEGSAPFLEAFFTATSATCVTGLIVQDTFSYWSLFGQLVILLLIQTGGMGVVTVAVALFTFSGRKIGLKQRWIMQESISAPQMGGIIRLTGFILRTTLVIESVGALLLFLRFCPVMSLPDAIWYAVFHSISAFCNAGFDLMGYEEPFSSLTGYVFDPLMNVVVMALITLGSIGFLTWHDVSQHGTRFRRYRQQSKMVICGTTALAAFSLLFFGLYEFSQPQWQMYSPFERLQVSVFQAVSHRTAGFNTIPVEELSQPGKLVTMLLMLIGSSPASTAGGFKLTTLMVLLLSVRAVFLRRDGIHCFDRRIPDDILCSAAAIFMLYPTLFLSSGVLICCVEDLPMLDSLFQAASALGTAGLSIVRISEMSVVSQLTMIFLMFFGRVGGLTMIYAAYNSGRGGVSRYPMEPVTVG